MAPPSEPAHGRTSGAVWGVCFGAGFRASWSRAPLPAEPPVPSGVRGRAGLASRKLSLQYGGTRFCVSFGALGTHEQRLPGHLLPELRPALSPPCPPPSIPHPRLSPSQPWIPGFSSSPVCHSDRISSADSNPVCWFEFGPAPPFSWGICPGLFPLWDMSYTPATSTLAEGWELGGRTLER